MLVETMQRLWAEIATLERPDTIIASPVFVAVADVIANLPPGTNWRRRKRLVNRAAKRARRGGPRQAAWERLDAMCGLHPGAFPPIDRTPLEWWNNKFKD